jgi:hypothetical protein
MVDETPVVRADRVLPVRTRALPGWVRPEGDRRPRAVVRHRLDIRLFVTPVAFPANRACFDAAMPGVLAASVAAAIAGYAWLRIALPKTATEG